MFQKNTRRILRFYLTVCLFNCSRLMLGQVWANLIDSLPNSSFQINDAVVDSNANCIYIGGNFWQVNQYPFYTSRAILRYNGTTFDTLQKGLDFQDSSSLAVVYNLEMFQNKLYVFGQFKKTGTIQSNYIGRWNGSAWEALNQNFQSIARVSDVYNGELYVGGGYDSSGSIAKFDGTNWTNLNYPLNNPCITALKNYQGKLYVSAMTSQASSCANLSYYNGIQWQPWVGVSGDGNKAVFGMTVIDSLLFVYGRFDGIAGTNCKGIAAYSANSNLWYGFGSGLSNSTWESIYNVQKINGEIFVSGNFYTIGDVSTIAGYPINMKTQLVKLVGNKWCALDKPFDNDVTGVVEFQNKLYSYGAFKKIGSDTIYGLARWDGGSTLAACSSTFEIRQAAVSISEADISKISIYPNPVSEILNLENIPTELLGYELSILSAFGEEVIAGEITNTIKKIQVSELKNGLYLLKIQGKGLKFCVKFLKN